MLNVPILYVRTLGMRGNKIIPGGCIAQWISLRPQVRIPSTTSILFSNFVVEIEAMLAIGL